MAYEWIIWKKLCVICYVLWYVLYEYVMCCVQSDIYDDVRYCHGMTFLIKFWNFTNFPNLNLESLLTWLPKIMSLRKSCSFSCMPLVCACIYPYLIQVCTNQMQLYIFKCRHRCALKLTSRRRSYLVVEHSSGFDRPSCFRGRLPIIF